MSAGALRRSTGQHALKITIPGNAAKGQHQRDVPPRHDRRGRPECPAQSSERSDSDPIRASGGVVRPARPESACGLQDERQRGAQADRDEPQLKDVGVRHRPQPSEHRVRRGHAGGEQDGAGEVHVEQRPEGRTDGDEQLGAPEQLAGDGRETQDRGPRSSEPRLERIDQRREAKPAHDPGEEHAADNEADAEAQAALDAKLNRRLVDTLRRTEQIPAVDPRRGHRQRRDDERHLPSRKDQIGRCAVSDLTRCSPADR